ncbi:MAG: cytochrome C552 [Gammaproteobacteria bacterium]|nr:cytochrome C552 [Gammaproteobacteria bacterium]
MATPERRTKQREGDSGIGVLFSRRMMFNTSLGGGLIFALLGILFWGGFNTSMEVTNSLNFCISCHEMEENVYKEYQKTVHYANRSGVRATCSDCHVPDPWVHKVVRKIQASREVLGKILGTIDTPEKFEDHRLRLAKNVWNGMKATDSRECRNCHNFTAMNKDFQKPRAQNQHANALRDGQTCIDCHKGIAHKGVRNLLSGEELEKREAPDPMLARPDEKLFELKDVAPELAAQRAQERVEQEAVAAAEREAEIKQSAAMMANSMAKEMAAQMIADAASGAAPAAGGGIDERWGSVEGRKITLLYPGQTSMEWILNGKDHGGARPFVKGGDRCFTCHDKEADKMGAKIVNGKHEKAAEPTPIPGKRGAIPVTVKAAHDGENLFLNFQWSDGGTAVADADRMDEKNAIKLAMMFATDKVEYADRAGCWGTCHHDANGMPHQPDGQDVVKYIKESRTKIEVKGRRGKKRGGWDKLRGDDEIQAALEAQKFMDLVRYKADGTVEDGHILKDRMMEGSIADTAFTAEYANGLWTVVMKRKLNSGETGDLPIEAGQLYNFGFAIHDDYSNGRYHHVSIGYKIGLDNPKAEINAVKW